MSGETPLDAVDGPHGGQGVVAAGAPKGAATVAVVALHGRGATAQGVVNLLDPVSRHGVVFLAPQGERSRWYPSRGTAPRERNQPHLDSALAVVDAVVGDAVDGYGIPRDHVVLVGFSQGASIAAEYAAATADAPSTVLLSGTLLGPSLDPDDYVARTVPTPVFLGYGTADSSVPVERFHETAAVFRALGADVTERRYEGVGHEVTDDEFAYVAAVLDELLAD